ncbi:hypothetical protein LCGC14_1064570 [marine sediment metagenome]|uniref:Uncharacterized protein n=1 Tax=marine sediment metagenome TaxID=412755 RepID=A0A0F9MPU7_9ZZZZ
MNKSKYINKLQAVRQHRQTHYLDTMYRYMDKVSQGEEAEIISAEIKVKERWNKNKAVNK